MSAAEKILLVAHNRRNLILLAQVLEKNNYRVKSAGKLDEVDQSLAENSDINAALIDITGFGSDIWRRCQQLRQTEIPFLILSPSRSRKLEQTGLAHGARSVLIKPLVIQELLAIIENMLGD